MTKHMKKKVLKRFLHAHGIYYLGLNRYDANLTCAKCIPQGYDQETNHWTWVDLLCYTRSSAGTFTLGNHLFCFLAPDYFAEQTQPSMPLVDLSLGFLVDALDRILPITSSCGRVSDFWERRQLINVDDFSFERLVIEMDIRQETIEDGVASNVW